MRGLSVIISVAIILTVFSLLMVFTADVNEDVKDDQTVNSSAYNISVQSLEDTGDLADKRGTLQGVAVAVIIIGLLIVGFGSLMRN